MLPFPAVALHQTTPASFKIRPRPTCAQGYKKGYYTLPKKMPKIEACDALDQLSTAAAHITNNVPMVQTIDQIIGAVSDQLKAQQLRFQREIQEQAKATNERFATLAEQMQQLILTTVAATNALTLATPRPPWVSSRFHGEEA
uniref:Uncharacterized protein n=1 Tax=Romanomermis culicivorax TaxID=13658 RepID=A0A915KSZ5_ROMCU